MHGRHTAAELHTAAALIAATLGVFICISQRHFILVASGPSSILTMTHHRCGLCLLASLCWLFIETAKILIPSTKAPVTEPIS